jgi:hypothetical protein
MVTERTIQGIFEGVDGVTAQWSALYFGQGTVCPSLNDHAVFRTFLRESSLGGLDPSLLYRVDYRGVSEARQLAIRKDEERVRAWKLEAVLDAAHHVDLIDARGEFRPCHSLSLTVSSLSLSLTLSIYPSSRRLR